MNIGNNLFAQIAFPTAIVLSYFYLMKYMKRNKKSNFKRDEGKVQEKVPEKWIKVGTVSKITMYPIKSMLGFTVDEAETTKLGLKVTEYIRDRLLMVVDKNGNFRTQKEIPKLCFVTVRVEDDTFILNAPNMNEFSFKLPKENAESKRHNARIYTDRNLKALDCGDEIGNWLDRYTGLEGLRMYYHVGNETQRRMTNELDKYPDFITEDLGAFQNETAFMLMNEDSVEELNKHLQSPVDERNFRPTITIKNAEPFGELNWTYLKIGKDTILKTARPCPRCPMVTINPDTGIRDPEGDPNRTLVRLKPEIQDSTVQKLLKNVPVMGMRMGLFGNEGTKVKINDPVYTAIL